jgi:hypothetical protein
VQVGSARYLPCPKLVYRDRSGIGDNIIIISY